MTDKDIAGLVGNAYEAKGFTSTSATADVNQATINSFKASSDVLMNIRMPEGTRGSAFGVSREAEFVLPPNTSFVVTDASRIEGGRISIDLLVTGQNDG
jgi:hypothetical protein